MREHARASEAEAVRATTPPAPAPGPRTETAPLAGLGNQALLRRGGGRPLPAPLRGRLEHALGVDLAPVRIHTGAAVDRAAHALGARAFAVGRDIGVRADAYQPDRPQGARLIAHEVAHTAQRAAGPHADNGAIAGRDHPAEREATAFADAFVAGRAPPRLCARAPALSCDDDPAALRTRLAQVQAQIAILRALTRDDDDGGAAARQRESLDRMTRQQARESRSNRDAGWGGPVMAASARARASATVSGNTVTVSAAFQITYLAMSDADARARATADMARIAQVIRDVWQVAITTGDYAGLQLRFVPTVTYLPRGTPRNANAFLIEVRAPDEEPSAGIGVTGTISLNPGHLEPARVRVVTHELAHLFGAVDAYGTFRPPRSTLDLWFVGRADPANRADLLGLTDPAVLARLRREGRITDQDVGRQSGPLQVWEEEATQMLRVIGLAPPVRRPDPTSEDFDPQADLDRVRREGEAALAEARNRRQHAQDQLLWIERMTRLVELEHEERSLRQRLGLP